MAAGTFNDELDRGEFLHQRAKRREETRQNKTGQEKGRGRAACKSSRKRSNANGGGTTGSWPAAGRGQSAAQAPKRNHKRSKFSRPGGAAAAAPCEACKGSAQREDKDRLCERLVCACPVPLFPMRLEYIQCEDVLVECTYCACPWRQARPCLFR